jgi:hypothetical protein
MLQLGLTYERTFDYERAGLEYGDALQIARLVLQSSGSLRPTLASSTGALLEPIFAQAWAVLKDPTVKGTPFFAACRWLLDATKTESGNPVTRKRKRKRPPVQTSANPTPRHPSVELASVDTWAWEHLKATSLRQSKSARQLNMLGDLAFFAVPQWPEGIKQAIEAYQAAATIASETHDGEEQARSAVSLALCQLVLHTTRTTLDVDLVNEFVRQLRRARRFGRATPSSRGPFSDSLAIYHLGLELGEELLLLVKMSHTKPDQLELIRSAVKRLCVPPSRRDLVLLSPLRERLIHDAVWRLRSLGATCHGKPPQTPKPYAFPARNRMLNMRSRLLGDEMTRDQKPTFDDLMTLWRHFDGRRALPPCRIALAAKDYRGTNERDERELWRESLDIAVGGKRYYAWLRDCYYLEDGFGPMLLRANFALTVGFRHIHAQIQPPLSEDERGHRAAE